MTTTNLRIEDRVDALERSLATLRNDHLPPSIPVDSTVVRDERLATAGWVQWQNISVDRRFGFYLLLGGQDLKASRIKVFASHIHYNIDPAFPAFTNTGGIGGTDPRYRFPGALRYGIVLFQEGGTTQNVLATNAGDAQEFSIENTKRVFVNVNDGNTDAAYADNHGAFDINILVINP